MLESCRKKTKKIPIEELSQGLKKSGDSRSTPAHNWVVKLKLKSSFYLSPSILGGLFFAVAPIAAAQALADAGWRLAWLKSASGAGLSVDGESPGWAWFHHSSSRADAGPSPRIKYRDLYHTAGHLKIGANLSNSGEYVRSSPDGVALFEADGIGLGLGPSTEVRLKAGIVQVFSGEIWAECKTVGTEGQLKLQGNHVEVEFRECPSIVHLRDDEFSNSGVEVSASSGKAVFRARLDGDASGEFYPLGAGERVLFRFPGGATGVDNRRFFSAMEPEPEFERDSISALDASRMIKVRSAPLPIASPIPVDPKSDSKAGNG